MAGLRHWVFAGVFAAFAGVSAQAADQRAQVLNQNAIGLLAAELRYMPVAVSLADSVQHENSLRVLPIAGSGALPAVADLAFLRGVDAALIPADALAYARLQGLTDGFEGKITYVARFGELRRVLVARKDLANVTALAGKRIATGPAQSAAFASGELIFGILEVPFQRVPRQGQLALQALMKGHADAALVTVEDFAGLSIDPTQYHVLDLTVPPDLAQVYTSTILTSDDLPDLIPAGAAEETLSSPLALAAFSTPKNSDSFRKIKRLSQALFSANVTLSKGLTVTSIAADIPGLTRHSAADEALPRQAAKQDAELPKGEDQ